MLTSLPTYNDSLFHLAYLQIMSVGIPFVYTDIFQGARQRLRVDVALTQLIPLIEESRLALKRIDAIKEAVYAHWRPFASYHISRVGKGCVGRIRARRMRIAVLQHFAALRIQAVWRGYYERVNVVPFIRDLYRQRSAAVIQRAWRRHVATRTFVWRTRARLWRIKVKGVTALQALFRGHMVRMKLAHLREGAAEAKLQYAAQRRARLLATRKRREAILEAAAVTIQRVWRGVLGRREAYKIQQAGLVSHGRVKELADVFLATGDLWGFISAINQDYEKAESDKKNEIQKAHTFVEQVIKVRKDKANEAWKEWEEIKAKTLRPHQKRRESLETNERPETAPTALALALTDAPTAAAAATTTTLQRSGSRGALTGNRTPLTASSRAQESYQRSFRILGAHVGPGGRTLPPPPRPDPDSEPGPGAVSGAEPVSKRVPRPWDATNPEHIAKLPTLLGREDRPRTPPVFAIEGRQAGPDALKRVRLSKAEALDPAYEPVALEDDTESVAATLDRVTGRAPPHTENSSIGYSAFGTAGTPSKLSQRLAQSNRTLHRPNPGMPGALPSNEIGSQPVYVRGQEVDNYDPMSVLVEGQVSKFHTQRRQATGAIALTFPSSEQAKYSVHQPNARTGMLGHSQSNGMYRTGEDAPLHAGELMPFPFPLPAASPQVAPHTVIAGPGPVLATQATYASRGIAPVTASLLHPTGLDPTIVGTKELDSNLGYTRPGMDVNPANNVPDMHDTNQFPLQPVDYLAQSGQSRSTTLPGVVHAGRTGAKPEVRPVGSRVNAQNSGAGLTKFFDPTVVLHNTVDGTNPLDGYVPQELMENVESELQYRQEMLKQEKLGMKELRQEYQEIIKDSRRLTQGETGYIAPSSPQLHAGGTVTLSPSAQPTITFSNGMFSAELRASLTNAPSAAAQTPQKASGTTPSSELKSPGTEDGFDFPSPSFHSSYPMSPNEPEQRRDSRNAIPESNGDVSQYKFSALLSNSILEPEGLQIVSKNLKDVAEGNYSEPAYNRASVSETDSHSTLPSQHSIQLGDEGDTGAQMYFLPPVDNKADFVSPAVLMAERDHFYRKLAHSSVQSDDFRNSQYSTGPHSPKSQSQMSMSLQSPSRDGTHSEARTGQLPPRWSNNGTTGGSNTLSRSMSSTLNVKAIPTADHLLSNKVKNHSRVGVTMEELVEYIRKNREKVAQDIGRKTTAAAITLLNKTGWGKWSKKGDIGLRVERRRIDWELEEEETFKTIDPKALYDESTKRYMEWLPTLVALEKKSIADNLKYTDPDLHDYLTSTGQLNNYIRQIRGDAALATPEQSMDESQLLTNQSMSSFAQQFEKDPVAALQSKPLHTLGGFEKRGRRFSDPEVHVARLDNASNAITQSFANLQEERLVREGGRRNSFSEVSLSMSMPGMSASADGPVSQALVPFEDSQAKSEKSKFVVRYLRNLRKYAIPPVEQRSSQMIRMLRRKHRGYGAIEVVMAMDPRAGAKTIVHPDPPGPPEGFDKFGRPLKRLLSYEEQAVLYNTLSRVKSKQHKIPGLHEEPFDDGWRVFEERDEAARKLHAIKTLTKPLEISVAAAMATALVNTAVNMAAGILEHIAVQKRLVARQERLKETLRNDLQARQVGSLDASHLAPGIIIGGKQMMENYRARLDETKSLVFHEDTFRMTGAHPDPVDLLEQGYMPDGRSFGGNQALPVRPSIPLSTMEAYQARVDPEMRKAAVLRETTFPVTMPVPSEEELYLVNTDPVDDRLGYPKRSKSVNAADTQNSASLVAIGDTLQRSESLDSMSGYLDRSVRGDPSAHSIANPDAVHGATAAAGAIGNAGVSDEFYHRTEVPGVDHIHAMLAAYDASQAHIDAQRPADESEAPLDALALRPAGTESEKVVAGEDALRTTHKKRPQPLLTGPESVLSSTGKAVTGSQTSNLTTFAAPLRDIIPILREEATLQVQGFGVPSVRSLLVDIRGIAGPVDMIVYHAMLRALPVPPAVVEEARVQKVISADEYHMLRKLTSRLSQFETRSIQEPLWASAIRWRDNVTEPVTANFSSVGNVANTDTLIESTATKGDPEDADGRRKLHSKLETHSNSGRRIDRTQSQVSPFSRCAKEMESKGAGELAARLLRDLAPSLARTQWEKKLHEAAYPLVMHLHSMHVVHVQDLLNINMDTLHLVPALISILRRLLGVIVAAEKLSTPTAIKAMFESKKGALKRLDLAPRMSGSAVFGLSSPKNTKRVEARLMRQMQMRNPHASIPPPPAYPLGGTDAHQRAPLAAHEYGTVTITRLPDSPMMDKTGSLSNTMESSSPVGFTNKQETTQPFQSYSTANKSTLSTSNTLARNTKDKLQTHPDPILVGTWSPTKASTALVPVQAPKSAELAPPPKQNVVYHDPQMFLPQFIMDSNPQMKTTTLQLQTLPTSLELPPDFGVLYDDVTPEQIDPTSFQDYSLNQQGLKGNPISVAALALANRLVYLEDKAERENAVNAAMALAVHRQKKPSAAPSWNLDDIGDKPIEDARKNLLTDESQLKQWNEKLELLLSVLQAARGPNKPAKSVRVKELTKVLSERLQTLCDILNNSLKGLVSANDLESPLDPLFLQAAFFMPLPGPTLVSMSRSRNSKAIEQETKYVDSEERKARIMRRKSGILSTSFTSAPSPQHSFALSPVSPTSHASTRNPLSTSSNAQPSEPFSAAHFIPLIDDLTVHPNRVVVPYGTFLVHLCLSSPIVEILTGGLRSWKGLQGSKPPMGEAPRHLVAGGPILSGEDRHRPIEAHEMPGAVALAMSDFSSKCKARILIAERTTAAAAFAQPWIRRLQKWGYSRLKNLVHIPAKEIAALFRDMFPHPIPSSAAEFERTAVTVAQHTPVDGFSVLLEVLLGQWLAHEPEIQATAFALTSAYDHRYVKGPTDPFRNGVNISKREELGVQALRSIKRAGIENVIGAPKELHNLVATGGPIGMEDVQSKFETLAFLPSATPPNAVSSTLRKQAVLSQLGLSGPVQTVKTAKSMNAGGSIDEKGSSKLNTVPAQPQFSSKLFRAASRNQERRSKVYEDLGYANAPPILREEVMMGPDFSVSEPMLASQKRRY